MPALRADLVLRIPIIGGHGVALRLPEAVEAKPPGLVLALEEQRVVKIEPGGRSRRQIRLAMPRQVWVAMAALLLLLVIRQYYVGGRIPLLREPEKFHVDTVAAEEHPGQVTSP